uniref:UPAR/Ly6 domain-containing protein n=1 Tax=Caenorhabditis japonica TaxID=281687 RepID=A0A8R1I5Q6_CAEJA
MLPIQKILVLLTIIGVAHALKCHLISYGSLTDPNAITTSTSLQECPIGANSCVKTIDYSRNVFSKQCQIGNCTTATGAVQAPANCFNTTSNGVVMATCCCYGDGCNTSPSQVPIFSSIMVLVTSAFLLS